MHAGNKGQLVDHRLGAFVAHKRFIMLVEQYAHSHDFRLLAWPVGRRRNLVDVDQTVETERVSAWRFVDIGPFEKPFQMVAIEITVGIGRTHITKSCELRMAQYVQDI